MFHIANMVQHAFFGQGPVAFFQRTHNGRMFCARLGCVVFGLIQRGGQRGAGGQVAQHIAQQALPQALRQADMKIGQ